MNNKKDIEEDIKILEDYSYAMASISSATEKDIRVSKAIENILADRERLEKENEELTRDNFKLNNELENKRQEYQETYKDVREELKELQVKANAYDSLVEKIKNELNNTKNELEEKYSADKILIFSGNTYMEKFKLIGRQQVLQELLDTEK